MRALYMIPVIELAYFLETLCSSSPVEPVVRVSWIGQGVVTAEVIAGVGVEVWCQVGMKIVDTCFDKV